MIRCPNCGSANTKKSSAIYEQGTSTSVGKGGGIGISSTGRFSVNSYRHSSAKVSTVAEKNSRTSIDAGKVVLAVLAVPLVVFIAVVLGAGFFAIAKIAFASVVLVVALAIWTAISPSDGQKQANEDYQNQWYCFQCGDLFQRDAT